MMFLGKCLSLLPSSVSSTLSNRAGVRHGTSIAVILLKDMEKRGVKGEVVSVKRGFARNFMIPRKIAGEFSILISVGIVCPVSPVDHAAYATPANLQKLVPGKSSTPVV
jgi:hypothetical protein